MTATEARKQAATYRAAAADYAARGDDAPADMLRELANRLDANATAQTGGAA